MFNKLFLLAIVVAGCLAQDYEDEYQPPQPQQVRQSVPSNSRFVSQQKEEKASEPVVAILKQINRHNEDGSYTYGYEASDGSFKIETKAANGEVKGKYGYTDETGKVRVVEYGANKFGFQPSGEGITVAPINFNDVKDEVEYEDEQPQQQYIPRPKQTKVPKSQAIKYAPVTYVQQKEPTYNTQPIKTPSQPVQYYEYEEETTPRPVQYVQHQQPNKLSLSRAPQHVPRQQNQYDVGIVYAPEPQTHSQSRPLKTVAQKYQQFESRSPQIFPSQQKSSPPATSPLSSIIDREEQPLSLFSPSAAPRYDVYRPKQYTPEPSQFAQQQPQQQPQYQYEPQQTRPSYASQPAQARSTSILDQLVKDPNYKIPQTSNPLHDISFGYSV